MAENKTKKATPKEEPQETNKGKEPLQEEAGQQEVPPAEQPKEEELLQARYDELQDQHLRLMAEYDNYRKRSQREKDEIYQNAIAAVLTKMLPVQDNFERAVGFDCESEEFRKGLELIGKGFVEVLASFGVEPFGEEGDPFDPQLHHAVMHIEDETLGENVVSQVLQKGYKIGDRILRYAMVQAAN